MLHSFSRFLLPSRRRENNFSISRTLWCVPCAIPQLTSSRRRGPTVGMKVAWLLCGIFRNSPHGASASEKFTVSRIGSIDKMFPNLLNYLALHEWFHQCQYHVEKADTIYDVHRFQFSRQRILEIMKKHFQRFEFRPKQMPHSNISHIKYNDQAIGWTTRIQQRI